LPASRRPGNRPESGAILHSRARFAEESARGSVFAKATPGQGGLAKNKPPGIRSDITQQGALRQSEIAP